ncbi:MAG: hypothetical protein R3B69_01690 [Candidatus Paceibacterota bacterium]
MKTKQFHTTENGFVLLLTLVVVSIILAIGLSMLHITLKQLTLSNLARESEIALHAAVTGLECMQYHRNTPVTRQKLLNEDSDPDTAAPELYCADVLPAAAPNTDHDLDIGSGELFYNYQYTYNVDTDKCVEVSLHLLDLRTADDDATRTIEEGLTELSCDAGSMCTTIFSRGFNRGCDNIEDLFTVQRELTIQY